MMIEVINHTGTQVAHRSFTKQRYIDRDFMDREGSLADKNAPSEPLPSLGAKGWLCEKPSDYVRPERDVFEHQAILRGEKTMTITIDQDIELLGSVQAGMRSHGFDRVLLSEDELRVQHFHQHLESLLGD